MNNIQIYIFASHSFFQIPNINEYIFILTTAIGSFQLRQENGFELSEALT